MWQYQKTLQYPINITNPNPLYAKIISSQLGGPDGELGASLRYLNQRFAMPTPQLQGLLTDIGTEELAHMEMIGTLMHQLTRGMTEEQIKRAGFEAYFVDHTAGVYPASAAGVPFTAAYFQSKGDAITDLFEDMAAEGASVQEPSVRKPLKILDFFSTIVVQAFNRVQLHKCNKALCCTSCRVGTTSKIQPCGKLICCQI